MDHQVITIVLEEKAQRVAYLIKKVDHTILLDPGAKHHAPVLLAEIKKHIDPADLSYIILQSNDYLNISSMDALIEAGFKGKVIANETGVPYLKSIIKNEILTIESIDYKLKLNNGQAFEFIPMPFLPYPEGFVTIDQVEGVLFSAHLFSQISIDHLDNQELIASINQFHEKVLPSVEFVRQALKKLKKFNIIKVYPRLGFSLTTKQISEVYPNVLTYDFYNTNQVVEHKNKKNLSYNYETICNHMLKRLETKYHRTDILGVFKDSDIHLELYPHVEIESTKLSGYKLWNGFFDIIYQKKGIAWLSLLEPIVKKYHSTYHIQLPAIYKAKTIEQQSKIENLNDEKKLLEQEVVELSSKISETTDKLLRCPITNLYNQRFMIGHLLNNIDQPLKENHVRSLMLVHIDNLLDLNKKYGKSKGDETLKHLVHLMHNIKHEETLLFKQNGAGIFVYKHEIDEKDLTAFAVKLSHEVKQSDFFIEPITVSISLVKHDELHDDYPVDEKVTQMIELSQMRLERAKSKGKDQIIDQKTDDKIYTQGMILLVDEDETYQNLMIKIFNRIHYEVVLAKDIDEAVEQLETHNIDIIVSEINLSKLDGFQFKHTINQSQTYRNIPFIMVSHLKNLEVVTRCNMLNVDLILQKPIIPEELIGHVRRIRDKKVSLL